MIQRNPAFANLTAGYLFPEIARRRREFAAAHPEAKIISLGIGNTTEPLTPHVSQGMATEVAALQTVAGYSGYGEDQGLTALRVKIAEVLYKTSDGKQLIKPEEVYISDGAKCDIGRLQLLFGRGTSVVVQDPAYPVYVDGSVLIGAAGAVRGNGYQGITYLPCTAENAFFPDLTMIPENSLIYFCSPNNPTGAVATREQLASLVKAAQKKGCIIIYDAAYSAYIRDEKLPKTIFEIDGALECAIEVNSFSKPTGFTGVRLGWSVVPNGLKFADGTPIATDWSRVVTTVFNGASNIAQYGGLASLDEDGVRETKALTDFYLENAKLIRHALCGDNFKKEGIQIWGGDNAPYVWVCFPGKKSWDVFDAILQKCHVVTTPGAGFGPAGESFIRFSAFGHRTDVEEACRRLTKLSL